jgi:hypothetical protein
MGFLQGARCVLWNQIGRKVPYGGGASLFLRGPPWRGWGCLARARSISSPPAVLCVPV